MPRYHYFVLILSLVLLFAARAEARERIRIVGSPSMLPFITTIAEHFSHGHWDFQSPFLEFTGTGSGFKLLCAGVGYQHPDINVASRPVSAAEFARCRANGLEITEMTIGGEGIVIISAKGSPVIDFSPKLIFSALAARVEINGALAANPHKLWSDIDPGLPATEIRVMGPEPNTVANDVFFQLLMEKGGMEFPAVAGLDEARRHKVLNTQRDDGALVERMKSEPRAVAWLRAHPEGFAIVPYAFFHDNEESLQAHPVEGAEPTLENIGKKTYSLTAPVIFYVKRQHVTAIPGLQEFLYESASERAISPDGYLADHGFAPLDDRGRNEARNRTFDLQVYSP